MDSLWLFAIVLILFDKFLEFLLFEPFVELFEISELHHFSALDSFEHPFCHGFGLALVYFYLKVFVVLAELGFALLCYFDCCLVTVEIINYFVFVLYALQLVKINQYHITYILIEFFLLSF